MRNHLRIILLVLATIIEGCSPFLTSFSSPTPVATATPMPLDTLQADATKEACQKILISVKANDTLSSIALDYSVPVQAIKDYNGLSVEMVFTGQLLVIPLCERNTTPSPIPPPAISLATTTSTP